MSIDCPSFIIIFLPFFIWTVPSFMTMAPLCIFISLSIIFILPSFMDIILPSFIITPSFIIMPDMSMASPFFIFIFLPFFIITDPFFITLVPSDIVMVLSIIIGVPSFMDIIFPSFIITPSFIVISSIAKARPADSINAEINSCFFISRSLSRLMTLV